MASRHRSLSPANFASRPRDFEYMPARNSGRRKFSFSILSGTKTAPFTYRPSIVIEPSEIMPAGEDISCLETPPSIPMRDNGASYQDRSSSKSSKPPSRSSKTAPLRSPRNTSAVGPSAPTLSKKTIEEDRFAYRALRAMKLATATKLAIADEESHLLSRIREEEFILEMLHEEVELTQSRKQTAIDQLDAIREGVEYLGVDLPGDEELEASIRRPATPPSPETPTRTPPATIYKELLDDMMERSPSSDASTEGFYMSPFSLSSQSSLPPPSPKASVGPPSK